LYDGFRSQLPNGIGTRLFRASDLEPLLRPNSITGLTVDSGSSALFSDLARLCPQNFGPSAISRRWGNLVTTLSEDLGSPGVIPYWSIAGGSLYPTNLPYPPNPPAANTSIIAPPYPGAPVGNVAPFPNPITPGTPLPNVANSAVATSPINSEFGLDFRWLNTALGSSVLSRIKLNRPLPPYPHTGSGLLPPYNPGAGTYGTFYDLTNTNISTQFTAALTARQTLANDIYRRLLAITGVAAPANPATPTKTDLAPRRWLAQLAVNIVDYIDDDDINTPFNFYNTTDGLPAASIGQTLGTTNPDQDDSSTKINNGQPETDTGLNPVFWVFGTELPKVVLNEVLAETQTTDTAQGSTAGTSFIKVWVELYNTMQNPATTAFPQNVQQQDGFRVPFFMSAPAGSTQTPYSPYRVSISQNLMSTTSTPPLPDTSANVLGKPNVVAGGGTTTAFPANTGDADFATPNGATAPNVTVFTAPNGTPGQQPAPANGPNVGPGIDPQSFFLIGPPTSTDANFQDPFVASTAAAPGVPFNIPILRTPNMVINPTWAAPLPATAPPDERLTGLTVTLRRLANPYLPFNGNPAAGSAYNPYITVDYLERIPIRSTEGITAPPTVASRGKRQPYAAWTLLLQQTAPIQPDPMKLDDNSPVYDQLTNAAGSPGGVTFNKLIVHTFGAQNFPVPARGNQFDWLVHLDRQPISPMELLHVSGYQPYQLTQQFIVPQPAGKASTGKPLNDNNAAGNMFKHYVPWLDALPAPVAPATTANVGSPWWFDSNLTLGTQSHRLYRLFEFLECGDRPFGVDAWGRIPGRVNINTIWDAEILQALIDANPSLGAPPIPGAPPGPGGMTTFQPTPGSTTNNSDPVSLIFNNMLTSRTPSLTTLGLSSTDRPFLPFSTGLNQAVAGSQYPNGTSVIQDTLLRLGTSQAANNNIQLLLFENPNDGTTTAATPFQHPYLQTQLLTKLYNNVTTRSNVFAVWLTVGFFEVKDPTTTPPILGAEIGRSEGRHVRHRMFAIVDRTNLNIFSTTFAGIPQAAGNPLPIIVTNTTPAPQVTVTPPQQPQTVLVTFGQPGQPGQLSGANLLTGATWTIGAGSTLVFEPGTNNEETVVLQAPPAGTPPGQFQATFYKSHVVGVQVIQRGNPGPWRTRYDPRIDPLIVPHYSIID
jgi:hypothetical protein